jgi:alkyl sulfatase BDS1-like metallo-beta-lactamase superfamily hydrolase
MTSCWATVNDQLLGYLPFEDRQDFEDAARGQVADLNGAVVKTADGRVVWDPGKSPEDTTATAALKSLLGG